MRRLTGHGGAPYVRDAIAINTTPQQSENRRLVPSPPESSRPPALAGGGEKKIPQGIDRKIPFE
jgi:hypothetical protein